MRLLIALFIVSCVVYPAYTHDHTRPDLQKWFEGLRAKGHTGPRSGSACCDGYDAKRVDDVDWESNDGKYRVRLNGQWYDVPEEAIVEDPNKAGPTMVWPKIDPFGRIDGIRCFMPGAMT